MRPIRPLTLVALLALGLGTLALGWREGRRHERPDAGRLPALVVARDSRALIEEAIRLYAAGQFPRACERFSRAADDNPASAALRVDVGSCFEGWGWQASGRSCRRPSRQPRASVPRPSARRATRVRGRMGRMSAQRAGSIRKSGWPYSTAWPFSTKILTIRPPTFDSISFISFIASMIQRIWPSLTTVPSFTYGSALGDGAR